MDAVNEQCIVGAVCLQVDSAHHFAIHHEWQLVVAILSFFFLRVTLDALMKIE